MSLRYLLDTNVVSEPLKPRPDAGLLAQLERHASRAALPSVVWHELLFGLERMPPSRRRETLRVYLRDAVLKNFPVLPYDLRAARWQARERARLTRAGTPPPFVDGQIAAIAATRGLELVTRNVRDFQHYEGLSVISWADHAAF